MPRWGPSKRQLERQAEAEKRKRDETESLFRENAAKLSKPATHKRNIEFYRKADEQGHSRNE